MTNTEIATICRKAADVLETKGWCQQTFARYASTEPTDPTDPDACTFCAYGAVMQVINRCEDDPLTDLSVLDRMAPGGDLVQWNDHPDRKAADVIGFFRATADRLEQDGE